MEGQDLNWWILKYETTSVWLSQEHHLGIHQPTGVLICLICNSGYLSIQGFRKHRMEQHPNMNIPGLNEVEKYYQDK
jgi:hypothetical protein